MTSREMFWVAVMFVCGVVLLASIYFVVRPAHGSAVCLTKSEARALWPRQHIYWFSKYHCWSNRRGGAPRNLRYDLIRETHARAEPPKKPPVIVRPQDDREQDYCCWPPLESLTLFADRWSDLPEAWQ